ncbi:MAG TPA: hypothetical protein VGD15_05980 [Kribbella sp.]|jgi:predicted permease
MTDPRAQRAVLTMSLVFVILPCLLLVGQRPGSASFVITVATILLGAMCSALVVLTVALSARKTSKEDLRSGHE